VIELRVSRVSLESVESQDGEVSGIHSPQEKASVGIGLRPLAGIGAAEFTGAGQRHDKHTCGWFSRAVDDFS